MSEGPKQVRLAPLICAVALFAFCTAMAVRHPNDWEWQIAAFVAAFAAGCEAMMVGFRGNHWEVILTGAIAMLVTFVLGVMTFQK